MSTFINSIILNNKDLSNLDAQANLINKIPPVVLMEEASGKIYETLFEDFNLSLENICIIAGFGNNGGDALSTARKLIFAGLNVDIYAFIEKKGSELFELQKEIITSLSIQIHDIKSLHENILSYTLIIDGLFGIGYKYRNDSFTANLFKLINYGNAKIVSIDTPSGLNDENNTGIVADYTYSIGFLKENFFNINTRKNIGTIKDLKISFDLKNIDINNKPILINQIEKLFRKETNFVHKYSKGGCISIGGQPGKYGSIIFTAESALKSGAGISLIITEKDNIIPINSMTKEIIIDDFNNLNNYIDKYTTIIIGPGLSVSNDNKNIIKNLFKLDKNFVLDASFFNYFDKNDLKHFKNPPILTPHSGEFKKFFTEESESLGFDTINCVSKIALKYNSYIILKDSFLTIASPDGKILIYDNPTRLLAQAGSGDILSGIIGGLTCQGYEKIDSILESIRIFYSIAEKFKNTNVNSYPADVFIEMIAGE